MARHVHRPRVAGPPPAGVLVRGPPGARAPVRQPRRGHRRRPPRHRGLRPAGRRRRAARLGGGGDGARVARRPPAPPVVCRGRACPECAGHHAPGHPRIPTLGGGPSRAGVLLAGIPPCRGGLPRSRAGLGRGGHRAGAGKVDPISHRRGRPAPWRLRGHLRAGGPVPRGRADRSRACRPPGRQADRAPAGGRRAAAGGRMGARGMACLGVVAIRRGTRDPAAVRHGVSVVRTGRRHRDTVPESVRAIAGRDPARAGRVGSAGRRPLDPVGPGRDRRPPGGMGSRIRGHGYRARRAARAAVAGGDHPRPGAASAFRGRQVRLARADPRG